MIKKIIPVIFLSLLTLGCKKNSTAVCAYDPCTIKATAAEIDTIKMNLDAKSFAYQPHCSGIFYQIINPGSGATPGPCSTVNVTYIGKITDSLGKMFDQATVSVPLASLINGWRDGIPLIKAGGHILLYIPPSLGYGTSGFGAIPPNSTLYFDVTLNSVQ